MSTLMLSTVRHGATAILIFPVGIRIFEIGGRNKGSDKLADAKNGYLALDEMPVGVARRIPLWLFGFLY